MIMAEMKDKHAFQKMWNFFLLGFARQKTQIILNLKNSNDK